MTMKRIVLHILFWTVFVLWSSFVVNWVNEIVDGVNDFYNNLRYTLERLPITMLSTYVLINYILPKYLFEEKSYTKFFFFFLLNFLIACIIDRLIVSLIYVCFSCPVEMWMKKIFNPIPITRNSLILLYVMGLASMIRFFKLFIQKEEKEHQLTKENLETKHAFLKAQVNPHFLFNALNNLYSIAVQKKEEEIAEGLENLSGIMHYLTYDSGSKEVRLDKEIELLQNYIAIQHLRFDESDDITISFNIEGETSTKLIAPVILLPLVENAFKHGIKPDKKALVSIKLFVKEDEFTFKVKNTFFAKSEKEITEKGIGLDNVKRRLELIYPDQYTFDTQQTDKHFIAALNMKLNDFTHA